MQGFSDVGVDARATKEYFHPQKVLIQVNRCGEDNAVGRPAIQQYALLKQQEKNVDKAIIVTTGRFTRAAEARADDINVKLIDGANLVDLIDR